MNKNKKAIAWLFAGLLVGHVWGAEPAAPVADCAGIADVKSKSRQLSKMDELMPALLELESQGEARFHPTYSAPASQCVFEGFDVGGIPVAAIYSPFEKGEHTLNWAFKAGGAEPRQILVLYNGMASLMAKNDVLIVLEERKGSILFYAMFRDPPSYAALKPMITAILDGSLAPTVGVRWPAGEKEPVIDAYDMKRLK